MPAEPITYKSTKIMAKIRVVNVPQDEAEAIMEEAARRAVDLRLGELTQAVQDLTKRLERDDEVWTDSHVADFLGVQRQTVHDYISKRGLPTCGRAGKKHLVRKADFFEWAARQAETS